MTVTPSMLTRWIYGDPFWGGWWFVGVVAHLDKILGKFGVKLPPHFRMYLAEQIHYTLMMSTPGFDLGSKPAQAVTRDTIEEYANQVGQLEPGTPLFGWAWETIPVLSIFHST